MEHVVYLDDLLSFLEADGIDTSVLKIVEGEFESEYINSLNAHSEKRIFECIEKINRKSLENASYGISGFFIL